MMLKHKVNRLCPHPGCNIAWGPIIGAVGGALLGGSKKTTTEKSEPWGPAQPHLTNALLENESLYNTFGPTAPYTGDQLAFLPQNMAGSVQGTIDATQANIPGTMDMIYGALGSPLSGDWMDPQVSNYMSSLMTQGQPGNTAAYSMVQGQPAGYAPGSGSARPADYWSSSVGSMPKMDAATIQGSGIDFTTALNQLLYGDPGANPWLNDMAGDVMSRTQQQFGDVSRGMQDQLQQALMGLRDISGQSGTLGGSRQALLSGEAMGRTNDALAREYGDMSSNLQGTLAGLYGGIFENDLNRKASLASQLFGADAAERMRQAELTQDASKTNMQAIIQDRAAQTAASANAAAASANRWMAEQQLKLDQQRLGLQAGQQQYMMGLGQQQLGMDAAGQLAGYSMLPLAMQGGAVDLYNNAIRPDEQNVYNLATGQYYESANAPYDAYMRYLNPITTIAGQGSTGYVSRPGDSLSGAMSGFDLGSDIGKAFGW